ncbi:MAG: hypothetical protein IT186_06315 [Acidobacteria bacterium]|nr:hypothetical protein [Acidobacteriota bacterium]
MGELRVTIQESMEHKREQEWRDAGVSEADILFSRKSAIDARDVGVFREFSQRGLVIVVRCPKLTARPWHGLLAPKTWATKQKTGTSGVAVTPKGQMFVSDYDLMCVWKLGPGGIEKVFISAAGGASRGSFTAEAVAIVRALNEKLVSRIQHGCQDDYQSPKNPGVKPDDHFAGFCGGTPEHLENPDACAQYYRRHGMTWPYSAEGKYLGAST